MESKNLVFKNGHFYDRATRKRVVLRNGAEICVVANAADFVNPAPVGNPVQQPLGSERKLDFVLVESNKFQKIYDAGTLLYFTIQRQVEGLKVMHKFEVKLLEDLYFYFKDNWKMKEYRLFDCACVVIQNVSATIDFFEEVHAGSLNEVYKDTFVHFFGNDGNPACNALDKFYDNAGCKEEDVIGRKRKEFEIK